MNPVELVGTVLLSSTFGVLARTVYDSVVNRKKLGADTEKVDAEAADVVTKAALALVEPLSRRIHEVEGQVEKLRDKVQETTNELDACRAASRAKDSRIREQERELDELRAQRRM